LLRHVPTQLSVTYAIYVYVMNNCGPGQPRRYSDTLWPIRESNPRVRDFPQPFRPALVPTQPRIHYRFSFPGVRTQSQQASGYTPAT